TVEGESVPRTDTTGNARRKQKAYADILGRTYKTETYEWDGSTVYSTIVNTFNGRDQVVNSRQYAGNSSSGTYQDTIATFDGHGRLLASHLPEQRDGNDNLKYTSYTYNSDDSVASITDGRGSTATYTYNAIGLNTQIEFSVPQNSQIPVTPTVTFDYDDVGNRTEMVDATGKTTYQYDSLSRMVSESKEFTGLEGTHSLNYQYHPGGLLKQMDIGPSETSVVYGFDMAGRVTSVTGDGFLNGEVEINDIVSDISYRAWNGVKSTNYGSNLSLSISYNNRLQVSAFEITDLMDFEYQYNADGRVKFAGDLRDDKFDRSYKYDHEQRLIAANTGNAAGGSSTETGPYSQSYSFNAFNNPIGRETLHWTETYDFTSSYTNNRRSGWSHDEDGNVTAFDDLANIHDASGERTKVVNDVIDGDPQGVHFRMLAEKSHSFDGDGGIALDFDESAARNWNGGTITLTHWERERRSYKLKSTVLGGAVVFEYRTSSYTQGSTTNELSFKETNIFLHGMLLGNMKWQSSPGTGVYFFEWNHVDPMSTTVGRSQKLGSTTYSKWLKATLDPTGASVGFESPYPNPPEPEPPFHAEFATPEATEMVEVDGVLLPLALFPGLASIVSRCPPRGCGAIRTENGWEYWTAFADGYEGYMPMGAHYAGYGYWSWKTEKERLQEALAQIRPNFFASTAANGGSCEFTLPDGTKIRGTLDANGNCHPSIGDFHVRVPVDFDITVLRVDYRSFRNGNRYGNWIDYGRLRPRTNPNDMAEIVQYIRGLNKEMRPGNELQAASTINSACSTLATGSLGFQHGEWWRGQNGKWYHGLSGRGPNQHTGPRSTAIAKANVLRGLGTATFYTGSIISGAQIATGDISPAQGALDVTMGAVGAFGGPKGMIIGGVYFGYRAIPETPNYARTVNTSICHGGQGPRLTP
ncbi:MAG TPA: hypothetical protein PKD24_14490, partial [Pyrinomonadaceae bacterium]|nr:hypothetical protein [Pyrinomonadaceae bacterium]HMP66582.1 hypothetical protein [Pyrinomonadaceae bacterium]